MPELRRAANSQAAVRQGGALVAFSRALRRKDADSALRCAARVPSLSLDRALLLTLLLADVAHPRYQAAARRFLVRFTVECETSLVHVKRLADALAHLHHPHFGPYAREGLDNLVGKLRARERGQRPGAREGDLCCEPNDLWIEFNSLPE
jgi:hypothetical protein